MCSLISLFERLMLIPKHTVLINAPRQLKALKGPFKTTKGFPDDKSLVYWGLTGDISFPGMHTSILREHRTLVLLERHKSLGVEEEGHWHGRMPSQPNSGHCRNPSAHRPLCWGPKPSSRPLQTLS